MHEGFTEWFGHSVACLETELSPVATSFFTTGSSQPFAVRIWLPYSFPWAYDIGSQSLSNYSLEQVLLPLDGPSSSSDEIEADLSEIQAWESLKGTETLQMLLS